MQCAFSEIVEKVYDKKEILEKSGLCRKELVVQVLYYYIACLRNVRASNFTSELVDIIEEFYTFLMKSDKLSYKKMTFANQALSICYNILLEKSKKDPNLAMNEDFQSLLLGKFQNLKDRSADDCYNEEVR